jgi:transposase-like protein
MDGAAQNSGPNVGQDASQPTPFYAGVDVVQIPASLERARLEDNTKRLFYEYSPIGPTEEALVRDLARQVAAMERWGEAAEAVERHAVRTLPQEAATLARNDGALEDAVLSGAMATEIADRCERHSLSRSRAFCRILSKLEQLQAKRKEHERFGALNMPPPFVDEAACESYLQRRLQSEQRSCPKCGSVAGYFLPSCRRWECSGCRAQMSLRSGTVMAYSALPLLVWFEAIRWLLWRPTIRATELAKHVSVERPTTVRNMVRRIREAMAAENATVQLAGLDLYYSRRPST